MYKNTIKIKNSIVAPDNSESRTFIFDKIIYLQDIIQNTILSIKKNKQIDIFSNNDANLSITILIELYEKTNDIRKQLELNKEINELIESLQKIVDKLSMIICGFGTKNVDDLLFISFGSEFKNIKVDNPLLHSKYELIKKYVQPIGYKIIQWKPNRQVVEDKSLLCSNKITEEILYLENANMFECFDIEKTCKTLFQKINGVRVVIQNDKLKKTLIINGILEDVHLPCFTNKYVEQRLKDIDLLKTKLDTTQKEIIHRIMETITFKDILIFGDEDIHKKMFSVLNEVSVVKHNKLDLTIKRFLELDLYTQRNMLINLLIYNADDDILYICYLLYDLITANSADSEMNEQTLIYDSLPWKIKQYFKDVVKYTIKYTNDMMQKYDIHRITLEQQIYLLKASETVKEKAMHKLKEIKGRPDDSGSKARQYLEGLIKIPFGIYLEEPILKKTKENAKWFVKLLAMVQTFFTDIGIQKKERYNNLEIKNHISAIEDHANANILKYIENLFEIQNSKQLIASVHYINSLKKERGEKKINIKRNTKPEQIKSMREFIALNKDHYANLPFIVFDKINIETPISLMKTMADMHALKTNVKEVETNLDVILETLDHSIYSHKHAKNQIMKIIGQWMNGEQSGYSFGFEGSPGIGKTSLAKKGLANCLKDEKGKSRPFAFIALGGSSNGSSIEGHGYTYVNSSWGKIVDILMETKCMNPIIYIDELDKVSKTELGREIISIFTHLIDSTQNDCYQDKYYTGIDLDLSKALFIFSYNDPDQIDRVLLDRIHRIKFDNLSLPDKLVVTKQYILPDINQKMGFDNVVVIEDDIIEYIIEEYTIEPGVRKLKEILFDLYGEINLETLKGKDAIEIPIKITRDNLESKYLVKYNKIKEKLIHSKPEIGIINGLWANTLGKGGIIQIQTLFFPTSVFLDLQLTGLQGDVMKESMNVAKSLAWNLTSNEIKKEWLVLFNETKCQGLHIHCPEGGISKDGPSAGAAITCAIYSLLNKKNIKNDVAMTGEITLSGEVTAIGGLDVKINGGIKAGIRTFLFPKENNREFLEWKKKHSNHPLINEITFIEVSTIYEAFEHVFE